MRAMKDSGIEWIGKIPKEWKTFRLKNAILQRDGGTWGEDEKGDNNDYFCIRIADFDYERFCVNTKKQLTLRNYVDGGPKGLLLKTGDLLIEKSGGGDQVPVGRCIVFKNDFQATFTNFIERIRVNNQYISEYILYLLAGLYSTDYIKQFIKQTTGLQNLDLKNFFGMTEIPILEKKEQKEIASFLDSKCAKIDEYLSRQQQVIEKLKEYKQSVITEAVTKGLNPDVPMKDSGVEWIGEIPEDWSIKKLKFFAKVKTGTTPSTKDSSLFDGEYCWYTPGDFKENLYLGKSQRTVSQKAIDECFVPEYDKGSILLIAIGATTGKIGYTTQKSSSNQQITCITIDSNFSSKYFAYYMKSISNEIKNYALYTTLAIINNATLKDFYFAVPPLEQQNFIASYLDTKCAAIDAAIERKQKLIDKMTEYKKSLIYEAVTGKMEV